VLTEEELEVQKVHIPHDAQNVAHMWPETNVPGQPIHSLKKRLPELVMIGHDHVSVKCATCQRHQAVRIRSRDDQDVAIVPLRPRVR
jgi:hypothetical protein